LDLTEWVVGRIGLFTALAMPKPYFLFLFIFL
jgi:hypothetical protein